MTEQEIIKAAYDEFPILAENGIRKCSDVIGFMLRNHGAEIATSVHEAWCAYNAKLT